MRFFEIYPLICESAGMHFLSSNQRVPFFGNGIVIAFAVWTFSLSH